MRIKHGVLNVFLAAAAAVVIGHAEAARADGPERTIRVTAKRFEYAPREIVLNKGEAVVIELTTLDRKHGFSVPALGIDVIVVPGHPTRVRIVPTQAGSFPFHCSAFCGSGHDDMVGTLIVR